MLNLNVQCATLNNMWSDSKLVHVTLQIQEDLIDIASEINWMIELI
jgi:hypothetical protein